MIVREAEILESSTLVGVTTKNTTCAHCDAPVNAKVVHGPGVSGGHPQHTWWMVCPVCSNGILETREGSIWPPPLAGRPINGLPDDIAAAWLECRQTFGAGAYTATELMCRKILMHVAVDVLGMEAGEGFLTYVESMEAKGHIAAGLKPAIDKIRQRGNFATHQLPPSSAEDAERTMRITHYLLSGQYEIAAI